MNRRFPVRRSLAPVLALCAFAVCDARAYTVNIGPGTRAIYLQVGNGSFTGGTQTLATFPVNTWRESCHTFSYANAASVASGTYTGRATYTLSAP